MKKNLGIMESVLVVLVMAAIAGYSFIYGSTLMAYEVEPGKLVKLSVRGAIPKTGECIRGIQLRRYAATPDTIVMEWRYVDLTANAPTKLRTVSVTGGFFPGLEDAMAKAEEMQSPGYRHSKDVDVLDINGNFMVARLGTALLLWRTDKPRA
jgi:hypothetical protein